MHRTKETLAEFWNKIREVLTDKFACILYRNNTRAINWLQKCGMEIVENDLDDSGSVSLAI